MTVPNPEDSINVTLATKCLELTQTLISMKTSFKFSLHLSSGFNFSISSLENGNTFTRNIEKKKKSPSTLRRNAKRREEYLKKKNDSSSQSTPKEQEKDQSFSCSICDYIGESQSVLNVRMNRMHKSIPQLDGAEPEKVCKPPNYRRLKYTDDTTGLRYYCLWENCGKGFFDGYGVKNHLRSIHKEQEPRCE